MRLIKPLTAMAALAAFTLAPGLATAPAAAQTPTALSVKDANSATQTLCAIAIASNTSLANCASLYVNSLPVSGANPVPVLAGGAVASTSIAINVSTAATTQLVAGVGAQKIYVSSYDLIAGGSNTVTWEYGTGTACGTGTTVLTGAYPLTAQVGLAPSAGAGPALFTIPTGAALCIVTSAAAQLSGRVTYVQQ